MQPFPGVITSLQTQGAKYRFSGFTQTNKQTNKQTNESQRRKVIDGVIEVVAYLHKDEDLRIDQALKLVSMCLSPLLAFSGPLVQWPAADFKTLTAIWLRAYRNVWNLSKSTATDLLTFLQEQGELQVKLQMGTLFDST